MSDEMPEEILVTNIITCTNAWQPKGGNWDYGAYSKYNKTEYIRADLYEGLKSDVDTYMQIANELTNELEQKPAREVVDVELSMLNSIGDKLEKYEKEGLTHLKGEEYYKDLDFVPISELKRAANRENEHMKDMELLYRAITHLENETIRTPLELIKVLKEAYKNNWDSLDDGGNECIAFDNVEQRAAYHEAAKAYLEASK